MCAGVCPKPPSLPERARGSRSGPALVRVRKREAESASPFCSVPEKRRCPAFSSADSPPPPVLRCRKRPSRPDALPDPLLTFPDPLRTLPGLKKVPVDPEAPAASPALVHGERAAHSCSMVTSSADDDVSGDHLCAFNSFQFWRVPLPELNLSLLDSPLSGGDEATDSAEAMET